MYAPTRVAKSLVKTGGTTVTASLSGANGGKPSTTTPPVRPIASGLNESFVFGFALRSLLVRPIEIRHRRDRRLGQRLARKELGFPIVLDVHQPRHGGRHRDQPGVNLAVHGVGNHLP